MIETSPIMASSPVSDFITKKILGIDVNERYSKIPEGLEQRAREILSPADVFLEDEPTVGEWIKGLTPTRDGAAQYLKSLFPSATWIPRYNLAWLFGDVIAGITIGLVVVPQAMAYALLAQLPPAFGLYTSFTGAVIYWLFGTSKDIVIGTTAVGSLLVGQVVSHVERVKPGVYAPQEVAHALSMLTGAILLFFGLFRLGWIIEFIPYIPISAFVTGASITIMSTQIPTALGIRGINNREAPYKVLINTLKALPETKLDAAIGIVTIFMLFAIRDLCFNMERRHPHMKRTWGYVSSLRLTFAMLLFTLISFLVNRGLPYEKAKFRIVGHIDTGFKHANLPKPDKDLLSIVMPQLPAVVIILIIEHIAIAKAMGRMYNYNINPSQEIMALGVANMFSPFVGGYVNTGSFGGSAVLSKAGVRTPLAGIFSAFVLVLALYVLTAVFYYIPNAALAGLIIHAVCNLIAPPKNLQKYWQLSPLELLIWIICVALAIFDSLETSIYAGIALSFALLLVRLARTRGRFLGRVQSQRVVTPKQQVDSEHPQGYGTMSENDPTHEVFLPLDRKDASNTDIEVETPYPGVFIYRFSEGYNYTNQAYHVDTLLGHVMLETRRMSEEHFEKESDRPWNDPGPKAEPCESNGLPYLRAIVLDFSAVNNLDITCIQGLVDLRNSLDRYSAPDAVEWHFANVQNRWTRRALASAGFGYPTSQNPDALGNWIPTYSIAKQLMDKEVAFDDKLGPNKDIEAAPVVKTSRLPSSSTLNTLPTGPHAVVAEWSDIKIKQGKAAIFGVDRPFFHVDLIDAVDAAILDAQNKDEKHRSGSY